jgi:hypothetical protein
VVISETGDFEKRLEELEEKELQRLESELQSVEERISSREEIHRSLKDELDEEIRLQKNRLGNAQRSDEPRIRDRLRELYRERREEMRSQWRDVDSWVERKLELEKQLDELGDLEELLE